MLNAFATYIRRHHLALIALFVALGGTAYAANQVGSTGIKNESIRSVDVRDDALRGADLGDDSVGLDELKEQQLGDPIYHATVWGDAEGDVFLDEDANVGFTGVSSAGTGVYRLTFAPDNAVCDAVMTPIHGIGAAPVGHLSIAQAQENQIYIWATNSEGELADLGTKDFGYAGFTIFGACRRPYSAS